MAGGIFPNYPFELNAKCVIFSIIIIIIFFYCPPKMSLSLSIIISFLIFVIAYVAMAWYDYQFECIKLALKKGTSKYGITGLFKPQAYSESQINSSKLSKEEKKLDYILITLLHLCIIAPLFLYIGIQKDNSNPTSIIAIIMISLFAILYHSVRILRKYNDISLGHIILASYLIIFSMMTKKYLFYYYSLILLGIYIGFKHGINLIKISHNLK